MKRIVVIGGSGFIGSHLCASLAAAGHEVIVPTRRLQRASHLLPLPTLELIEADVFADTALDKFLSGADALVNLVGILHSPGGKPYGKAFAQAHVELPAKLTAACQRHNIANFVHIGALGADANAPSEYLRSKAAGEAAIRQQTHPARLSILRPSVVFGRGDSFLTLFARLCELFPVLPLGGAEARFQPVWVGDVVAVILRCLTEIEPVERVLELAGPRVYTLAELVRYAGKLVGKHPRVLALPESLAMLQAWLMELAPEPPMSRDNLRSMRRDNVVAGTPLPFGISPTSLETIAPSYIHSRYADRPDDVYRKAAGRKK